MSRRSGSAAAESLRLLRRQRGSATRDSSELISETARDVNPIPKASSWLCDECAKRLTARGSTPAQRWIARSWSGLARVPSSACEAALEILKNEAPICRPVAKAGRRAAWQLLCTCYRENCGGFGRRAWNWKRQNWPSPSVAVRW